MGFKTDSGDTTDKDMDKNTIVYKVDKCTDEDVSDWTLVGEDIDGGISLQNR